jgi:hypothetical protein
MSEVMSNVPSDDQNPFSKNEMYESLDEALRQCLGELDRLKVAYAFGIENQVEGPNIQVFRLAWATLKNWDCRLKE